MVRAFRWLALAGVVATVALVGPGAALACSGDSSATSIYSECVPTAKGGSHSTTKKPVKKPVQQVTTTTYVQNTTPPPPPVKPHHSQKPKHHHPAKIKATKKLASDPNVADPTHLKPMLASAPTKADLGSTFDLGTGPTVFFALLLGTVLLLLGTGGVRSWRNRHRV
jgi:hypothetical protein